MNLLSQTTAHHPNFTIYCVHVVLRRLEERKVCRLDLVLLSEIVNSRKFAKRDINVSSQDCFHPLAGYPINALRNESLKRARTDLVLLLDVDFVVSANAQVSLAIKGFASKSSAQIENSALGTLEMDPSGPSNPLLHQQGMVLCGAGGPDSRRRLIRCVDDAVHKFEAGSRAPGLRARWAGGIGRGCM